MAGHRSDHFGGFYFRTRAWENSCQITHIGDAVMVVIGGWQAQPVEERVAEEDDSKALAHRLQDERMLRSIQAVKEGAVDHSHIFPEVLKVLRVCEEAYVQH